MSISKRSPRAPQIGLLALVAFVAWFGLSLKFPPAGTPVSSARLAVYVLPAVVFLAGYQLAARGLRHRARSLDVVPGVAAGATLLGATQLPRAGVAMDDWQAGSLLAFCTVLALWAGMLAHQLLHHLLGSVGRGAGRSIRQARRLTVAIASAAALLGAMGMWIGFVPGSAGLVRHGLLCLVASVVMVLSRRGGEWFQTLLVLTVCFAGYAALHTVQPDPGLWRPAAFAGAMILTGGAGRAWVVQHTRLLLSAAAVIAAAYAQLAQTASVPELMTPRIGLAAICGVLLAAAAANQSAARMRARSDGERERLRQRALTSLLGFVLLATPWMAGMNWPWLSIGAGLLLACGLITTRP